MIRPPKLRKGDKVAFIAPARKVVLKELEAAIKVLEAWGLVVVFPKGLFLEEHQFAGTDNDRINHIQSCINDEDIRALFCVRGGYGTSRIIDALDFTLLQTKSKWFVGFSDFTVLLGRLFNEGLESIHGPVALLLDEDQEVKDVLYVTLFDSDAVRIVRTCSHSYNQLGKASGKLVGGNLSVLVNQIGTSSFPELHGNILFIEDLDEYLYHIDRMIIQLDRIGAFQKISGLVVGYMSGMHDNAIKFGGDAYQIISNTVNKYNIPVAFGFPIGHEKKNIPVIVGKQMTLEVVEFEVLLTDN